MNNFKQTILLLLLSFVCACDPVDNKLKLFNNTTQTLNYKVTCLSETELVMSLGSSKLLDFIEAGVIQSDPLIGTKGAWERFIQTNCSGTLKIYSFDSTTVKNNNWQEIFDKALYRNKIELTQKHLDSLGWIVTLN
jgi:hypothetical protein